MALKKCRECGTDVSDEAKTCPKCGVKKPVRRVSFLAKIGLGCLGLIVIGSFMARPGSHTGGTAVQSAAPSSGASASGASLGASASVAGSGSSASTQSPWQYKQEYDDMSKGPAKWASTDSSNTLEFEFPYSGKQHATLALRKHPRYGKADVRVGMRHSF